MIRMGYKAHIKCTYFSTFNLYSMLKCYKFGTPLCWWWLSSLITNGWFVVIIIIYTEIAVDYFCMIVIKMNFLHFFYYNFDVRLANKIWDKIVAILLIKM